MNDRFLSPSRLFSLMMIALLPWLAQGQSPLDSLPPTDSLTDWQVNEFAKQFAAQTRRYTELLTEKAEAATNRRTNAEESWKAAKADSTTLKTTIDSLSGLLKTAKNVEKTALRQQNQADKTLELAIKTEEADNVIQRKNLRRIWKELQQLHDYLYPPAPAPKPDEGIATPPEPEKKREKKKKPVQEQPVVAPADPPAKDSSTAKTVLPTPVKAPAPGNNSKKYDPAQDVMLNPPALPCLIAVQTRDEFSGEIYRRTASVELFRHSPPALKSYLQGQPNVLCEAALASAGASTQLCLTFTIRDPNPRKAFGKLEKGSLATLWLMDGSSLFLENQQGTEGIQNPDNQSFVFQAQYNLTPEVLKKIRRSELDKIRIAWSSGYEDYDVQFVRLLLEQAKCLAE